MWRIVVGIALAAIAIALINAIDNSKGDGSECQRQLERACSFFNKMFVDELVEIAKRIPETNSIPGLEPPVACTDDWHGTGLDHLSLLFTCSDWDGRDVAVAKALEIEIP